jgi:sugar-specific transcriptional regulator TrmB
MKYLDSLKNLGLDEREQEVYLALLQLESATATRIAAKTGQKRSTIYDTLYRLLNVGFVSEVEMHNTKVFLATPPEKLKEIVENKKRDLESDLPYLLSIYNQKPMKPKVSYFYGLSGIKQLYDDTLATCEKDDEILAYVTNETVEYIDDYSARYVERRVAKGIKIRGIYQDTEGISKYLADNEGQLRTSKVVSRDDYLLKNEINIYANKIIIITYSPEPYGILIESKAIVDTQRAIFEMAWQGIK